MKTDERWQQLLSELESVRLLIRTLPRPVLSSPIADGPWNESFSKTEKGTRFVTKNPIPSSALGVFYQLALAASLLVGVFVTVARLRTDRESSQIAKSAQESSSKILPEVADSSFAMKLEELSDEKKSELAKEVELQMQGGTTAAYAPLHEPVETHYATQSNSPIQNDKSSLKDAAGAVFGKDDRFFSYVELIPAPEQSIAKYLWKSRGSDSTIANRTLFPLTLSDHRQYELCFQRSEWPMVATELGKIGIHLSMPKSNGAENAQVGSDRQSKFKRDEALSVSPPTLVGAIDEPTDWIRVIVKIESP